MSTALIFTIGFTAQAFFAGRILCQWILSEKAKKVVSPTIFWILSIAGSYLLFIYGWLRDDFAIIFGQFISYYIYLWNLKTKRVWLWNSEDAGARKGLHLCIRGILVATPIVAACLVMHNFGEFIQTFFHKDGLPLWLIIYGSTGQVIFALRFIYQWFYSVKRHESILPIGFWIISLVGSLTIVSYGIYRLDPVLILGQSFGLVAYVRNIMLSLKQAK